MAKFRPEIHLFQGGKNDKFDKEVNWTNFDSLRSKSNWYIFNGQNRLLRDVKKISLLKNISASSFLVLHRFPVRASAGCQFGHELV